MVAVITFLKDNCIRKNMSRGQPQTRSQSVRRILERCQNSRNSDDAIIIDDDTETADVVRIDNPNTYQGSKNAKTTRLSYAPGGVIYIDDEEEDPINSSTTVSNQFTETFSSLSLSENSDGDSYFMFVRNGNVCCDHTGPSRNSHAVDLDSENSMTQSTSPKSNTDECDEFDCSSSDCEIMEDHSGIIREQWEKAASRKKESCQFASTDQAGAPDSTFYTENPSHGPSIHDADVANCFERMPSNYFEEMLAGSSNCVEQDPSVKIDSTYKNEDFHFKATDNISVAQSYPSSHIPNIKPGNWRESNDSNLEECPKTAHSMDDGRSFLNNDVPPSTKYSFFPCQNFGKTKFFDKEELSTRRSYTYFKWDGKHVAENNDLCSDKVEHKLDEDSFGAEAKHEMVVEREATDVKESKKRDFEESLPFCTQQHEEQPIKTQSSTFYGDMDYKITNKEDEIFVTTDIRFTSHELDDMPHGIESLICDRERHKKTDEYKRAVEEEWASRQQQLQIQVVFIIYSYWIFSY